jgi:hypothetical protein
MLNKIINTNPAGRWTQLDFRCEIKTPSDHKLKATFKGYKVCKYTYEDVLKVHGHDILVDPKEDYGEYLCIASLLATNLNAKIEETQKKVLSTTLLAVDLLHALTSEDYGTARSYVSSLGDSLVNFGADQVKTVWGKWMMDVVKFIDSRKSLGIDEIM